MINKVEALENLGISEKAAKAYLALLELGQGSAYSVAKKSGLKQPTAYVVLEELRTKGLALKIPRPRKHLFIPRPPAEAVAMATEKISTLGKILPELLALAGGNKTDVKTLFFEGVEGLRQGLYYRIDELNNTELTGFYASGIDTDKKLYPLFHEFSDELVARNITTRGIVPDHASVKEFRARDKKNNRNMKIVASEKYSANISIDASDHFIRIVMFKEMHCVIIDNPDVARTVKQIFNMVWEMV